MARLKRIGVLCLAKMQAVIMASAGLIAGILYAFGGAVYDVLTTGSVNLGTALAFLALIGMPVVFAAIGFVVGAIGAPLYNWAAGWFGGEEEKDGDRPNRTRFLALPDSSRTLRS